MTPNGIGLHFYYDATDRPFSVIYGGATYYYVTNLQGDVVAILDSTGAAVVEYTYDAWGRPLSKVDNTSFDLGDLNPLRYRGYVYDHETGLYYLQSRYYNPEWGRFISADNILLSPGGDVLGNNLFAYCLNNPVMGYDPSGCLDWELIAKIALTTVVVAACLTGVGAIAAAAATAAAVSVSAAVTTAVVGAGLSTMCAAVDGGLCATESGGKFVDGFLAGAIGGSVGALVSKLTNPAPLSDAMFRMNIAGRATSSLIYDVTYDIFNHSFSSKSPATYAIDVSMDAMYSTVFYYYTGSISSGYVETAVNGLLDGIIDIFQVNTLFS